MSAFDKSKFPMLFANRWSTNCWNNTRCLIDAMPRICRDALSKEYEELIRCAPIRRDRRNQYFVDSHTRRLYFVDSHTGRLSTDNPARSNRFEERLAIALRSLDGNWPRSSGGRTRLLDYQFPLNSTGQDGIGKIDLVGVSEARFVVIEMKVALNGRGDTPLKALMQGLRYAAVAYANRHAIIKEAKEKERIDVEISTDPPIVQILAPKAWWKGWTDMKAAGNWEPAFAELIEDMSRRLGIDIECLALTDIDPCGIDDGRDRDKTRLCQAPSLYPVTGSNLQIGDALPPHRSEEEQ